MCKYAIILMLFLSLIIPFGCSPTVIRFATPNARIYFDTGTDDEGELDIFKNGNLTADVTVAEALWDTRDIPILKDIFKSRTSQDTSSQVETSGSSLTTPSPNNNYYFGPSLGFGLSGPANDSEDGSKEASGAPIALFTIGWLYETHFKLDDKRKLNIKFEVGYAKAFSASEELNDPDDGAIYFGVSIPLGLEFKPDGK